MLALEIELLTGVYRASLPDRGGAEWPPHPERVFSALAQAWGDGGRDPVERAALEWLEALPAPAIAASDMADTHERSAPTVFVPPNDVRGDDVTVLPDRRRRHDRTFRVAAPADPVVKLIWQEAPAGGQHGPALDALAHRVASLGHSASLVRFSFGEVAPDGPRWEPDSDGSIALRVPHRGRLRRLEEWRAQAERPRPGVSLRYREPGSAPKPQAPKSMFGGADDWFVFEDSGGSRPDLLAFAHVAKCVRASLMSHGPQPPPELISGHASAGAATTSPHVTVVPLANVGWSYATGDLLGFAVVLPRGLAAIERRPVLEALAGFAHLGQEQETAWAELRLSRDLVWRVERTAAPSRSSLRPARWCAEATVWASVTPVLLDRFPEHDDPVEEARLIAAACRNIGLPEPLAIEIHKHSALRGAPSAYPARGNRTRPDWSFPAGAKFVQRPRRHVVLRFAGPVEGPVILGAGRFHGLGLCLPLDREHDG